MDKKEFIGIRERCGCCKTKFGKLFGVSDQTILRWEQGLKFPEPDQYMIYQNIDIIISKYDIDTRALKNLIDTGMMKFLLPYVDSGNPFSIILRNTVGSELCDTIQEKLVNYIKK